MAEFTEVMKQAKRMCDSYEDRDCRECPLSRDNTKCGHSLCIEITSISAGEAAEIERAVMSWSAAHPEPRYPTWKEWYDTEFEDVTFFHRLCPAVFGDEYYACGAGACDKCRDRIIPNDIAEKLGIRPKEEG